MGGGKIKEDNQSHEIFSAETGTAKEKCLNSSLF